MDCAVVPAVPVPRCVAVWHAGTASTGPGLAYSSDGIYIGIGTVGIGIGIGMAMKLLLYHAFASRCTAILPLCWREWKAIRGLLWSRTRTLEPEVKSDTDANTNDTERRVC